MTNRYRILGVSSLDSEEAIRRAYRDRITLNHPDHAENDEDRKERTEYTRSINDAYSLLRDPVRRAAYDLRLRRERHGLIDENTLPSTFASDMFGVWAIRNPAGQWISLVIITLTLIIAFRAAGAENYSPLAEILAGIGWLLLLVKENGLARSPLGDLIALVKRGIRR